MSTSKSNFWSSPLTKSRITSDDVKMPEMLLGYFIGPFGALLSSGIFTSILQNYFTDVLKLDLGFLTTLQLVSTVLIVASNLIVGQLIEHTRALAGKARPWILLSALTGAASQGRAGATAILQSKDRAACRCLRRLSLRRSRCSRASAQPSCRCCIRRSDRAAK